MKWFALLALVALQCSCTTLSNRRDLYSPEPASDSREGMRQWNKTTTTTTATVTTSPEEGSPPPFR